MRANGTSAAANGRSGATRAVGAASASNKAVSQNKPPATGTRQNQYGKPKVGAAGGQYGVRGRSRGADGGDGDAVMQSNKRNNSTRRQQEMNSDAISVAMSMASGSASKYPRDSAENTFEITDHLMEQLGTPQMLLQELKHAKQEIETLKRQLEVKEKSVANYRADATKLRRENFELKKQVLTLKNKQPGNERTGNSAENNQNDDLQEARRMARPQRRGNDEEAQMLAQLQMAMHMSRADHRNDERQMIMMALAGGAGAQQAQEEEDRLLQRAIEESKNDVQDPNNPDVDRMTYEQLMELGDNAGQVSRGYSQAEISAMQKNVWYRGRTKESSCLICMEDFSNGELVKILPCGHEYKAKCIDEWLKKEKRCPICSQPPI